MGAKTKQEVQIKDKLLQNSNSLAPLAPKSKQMLAPLSHRSNQILFDERKHSEIQKF